MDFFFFFPVELSDLPCVSWKQNWELKESTLEGKKSKDAFHHLANQKQRYGLLFFLSSPPTPGNIGSPDSIGKGKNDLILIGHCLGSQIQHMKIQFLMNILRRMFRIFFS